MKKVKKADVAPRPIDVEVEVGPTLEAMDPEAATELCRTLGITTLSQNQAKRLARIGVNVDSASILKTSIGAMHFNQTSLIATIAKLHKTLNKADDNEVAELARAIGYTGDKLTRAVSVAAKDLGPKVGEGTGNQPKKFRSFAPGAIVANLQQNNYYAPTDAGAPGGQPVLRAEPAEWTVRRPDGR